jgi:hypothetical protein
MMEDGSSRPSSRAGKPGLYYRFVSGLAFRRAVSTRLGLKRHGWEARAFPTHNARRGFPQLGPGGDRRDLEFN